MDDLISRQATIEVLAEMQGRCTTKEALIQNSKIWQQIKDLPAAQPERKKGWWTVTSLFIKCSECGEAFMLMPQNYCPNCGADMRGEGDECM